MTDQNDGFLKFLEEIVINQGKIYPITITQARYSGTYEGGAWVAFNNHAYDVPTQAFADDITCMTWWDSAASTNVGRGTTPQDAYQNLLERLGED